MFEERDIGSDVCALALAVLAVFLGLSLISYNPSDPQVELVAPLNRLYTPDVLDYPQADRSQNICGPWGALAASMMFELLGIGAFFTVISLGVVAAAMMMQVEVDAPALRTVGWLLALVGFCTTVQTIVPWLTPGPVLGSGGFVGALCAGFLKIHFATTGAILLAFSLLLGGLMLCTDYVVIHLGLFIGTLTFAGAMALRPRGRRSAEWEDDEFGQENDEESEFPVVVRGQRFEDDGAEESDEAYDDEAYDDAEEESDADEEEEFEDDDQLEEQEDEDELRVVTKAADVAAAAAGPAVRAARGGRRRLSLLKIRRPPEPEDRETVMNQLDEASEREDTTDYELPSIELLSAADDFCYDEQTKEVRRKAKVLEKTFASFGYDVKVVEIETGPVIAQYEVELESGLRLSKITGLADDLAIALRVPSVRIVAPIPGKNTVGIEVPNKDRQLVRLREVMTETNGRRKKMNIPIFLGKDVSGSPMTVDLSAMPHLLIAGRTGTGKSVCLNAIIASILMTRRPDEVRMLMIDPKMVELSGYRSLPHLMHPVVTDMRKAEAILAWAVEKMEERYAVLAQAGVRHVTAYNQLGEEELYDRLKPETEEERQAIPKHMPFIVIVADEIADLMMTAGKDVEQHIIRLAQKSRAVGIHLILATQKPTVDVITGLIKSNLPARIAFQVASRTDSRVVLDEMGADKLLGNGDMLFLWPGTSTLIRGQGTFLSDEEINAVVEAASTGEQNFVTELVQLKVDDAGGGGQERAERKQDDLYDSAVEVVIREGRGSVSLLQRSLGIGYGRAARLIDFMAEDGIVGTYNGSQAREVLLSMEEWEAIQNGEAIESLPGVQPPAPQAGKLPPAPLPTSGEKKIIRTDVAEVQEVASDEPVDTAERRQSPPTEVDSEQDEGEELEDQEYDYEDEEGEFEYEEGEYVEGEYEEEDEEYEDPEEDYEYEDEEEYETESA